MVHKFCRVCREEFFARWRNTPEVCESCKVLTVLCSECGRVVALLADPAQLDIFGVVFGRPLAGVGAECAPWARPASNAERRRAPFH